MGKQSFENYGRNAKNLNDYTIIARRYHAQKEAERLILFDIMQKLNIIPNDFCLELKNQSYKILLKNKEFLEKNYRLETYIFHFNWSGNPLKPNYEQILAFPIHGLINDKLSIILKAIIDFNK